MTFRKLILCFCATTVTTLAFCSAEPTLQDKKSPVLSAVKITGIGLLMATTGVGLAINNYVAREERCANEDYSFRAYECRNEYSEEGFFQACKCLFYAGTSMTVVGTSWLVWEGLKTGSLYSSKACKAVGKLASHTFREKK